ncbi:hypothetical protein JHW43_009073 [Diplocarpon mali]|nr:hypothetical protein JHW43_009073 [Diplocarpon mali]
MPPCHHANNTQPRPLHRRGLAIAALGSGHQPPLAPVLAYSDPLGKSWYLRSAPDPLQIRARSRSTGGFHRQGTTQANMTRVGSWRQKSTGWSDEMFSGQFSSGGLLTLPSADQRVGLVDDPLNLAVMTGQFSEIDPRRCSHYARIFQHLNIQQANGTFWLLFSFVLLMMCVASLQHHKSISITESDKSLPGEVRNSEEHKTRNRRKRMRFLSIASLCLILSVIATVFECFALFNIEFCAGEDLMQLYWGFWSILQVGSNIAIVGVLVQFWIVLGDVETPSWAVALGTPVLVFAAVGFVFRAIWKEFLEKFTGKKEKVRDEESGASDASDASEASDGDSERKEGAPPGIDRSMSTAPTIVNDDRLTTTASAGAPQPQEPRPGPPAAVPSSRGLWSRDLQYLLGSVVHGEDRSPPRELHIHHYHHAPAEGRDREQPRTQRFASLSSA